MKKPPNNRELSKAVLEMEAKAEAEFENVRAWLTEGFHIDAWGARDKAYEYAEKARCLRVRLKNRNAVLDAERDEPQPARSKALVQHPARKKHRKKIKPPEQLLLANGYSNMDKALEACAKMRMAGNF